MEPLQKKGEKNLTVDARHSGGIHLTMRRRDFFFHQEMAHAKKILKDALPYGCSCKPSLPFPQGTLEVSLRKCLG